MTDPGAISAGLLKMAPGPGAAGAGAQALQRQLKLKDAAEQFEGMMLQEMLKPMQEGKDGAGSFGGVGGGFSMGEEDRDDTLDTIGSFGIEAVAKAIAKAGGIGLAKQVMREVGALDSYTQSASGAKRGTVSEWPTRAVEVIHPTSQNRDVGQLAGWRSSFPPVARDKNATDGAPEHLRRRSEVPEREFGREPEEKVIKY